MPKITQELTEQTVDRWPHALQFILLPVSRTWPARVNVSIIGGIAMAASLSGAAKRAIIVNMALRRRRKPIMVKRLDDIPKGYK